MLYIIYIGIIFQFLIINNSLMVHTNPGKRGQQTNIQIYMYVYNIIEQCALPVTTIMALWQLVNLGT